MKKGNKILFNILIFSLSLIAIYFVISIYFTKHFYIGTKINGVNISCKTIDEAHNKIQSKISNYNLSIEERYGFIENISGKNINLKYEANNIVENIKKSQNQFLWPLSFLKKYVYNESEIFSYDKELLKGEFYKLNCISGDNIIKPQNARLEYTPTGYIIVNEVYGNTINTEYLYAYIINSICTGVNKINLDNIKAYENPIFTSSSEKVLDTRALLNTYISATIYYTFDNNLEVLDNSIFNEWIDIGDSMEILFNENMIEEYIKNLCKKYDTFNKDRNFSTTTGKIINVIGGDYGWRINKSKEKEAIIEDIKNGETIMREPIYIQRALGSRENDIGDTYVEINLSNQCLWFYKEGKLIVQGDIVSGNISRGFGTPEGTYTLNYKQKNATLRGASYTSSVKYWMPFNCNIGLHDASWRSSFGGSIYKNNGSHGCVNTSDYIAKKVYENIEPGTPIICYTEE